MPMAKQRLRFSRRNAMTCAPSRNKPRKHVGLFDVFDKNIQAHRSFPRHDGCADKSVAAVAPP